MNKHIYIQNPFIKALEGNKIRFNKEHKEGVKAEEKVKSEEKAEEKTVKTEASDPGDLVNKAMVWLAKQFVRANISRNGNYVRVPLRDTQPPSTAFKDAVELAKRLIAVHKDNGVYMRYRLNTAKGPIIGSAIIAEKDALTGSMQLVFAVDNEQPITGVQIIEPRVARRQAASVAEPLVGEAGGEAAQAAPAEDWSDLL